MNNGKDTLRVLSEAEASANLRERKVTGLIFYPNFLTSKKLSTSGRRVRVCPGSKSLCYILFVTLHGYG